MSDDALILRTVDENDPLDNERGVTYRVKQETGTPDNKRGVTYRVKNVGGGSATIDPLSITPSTSAQTITASGGTDGYSPVNVAAVDASIDANITAGNIKKDVSILGVTGTYEGTTPTGTMYIISNGTYNVADKAIANVNVPTTAPAHYIEKGVDANGKLINSSNIINLTGVTDLSDYALYNSYYSNPNITGVVNFSSLTRVTGIACLQSCFYNCIGITGANLSSLTEITGATACSQMFQGCSSLTSFDLSSLEIIDGNQSCQSMFRGTAITSVNLTALKSILGPSFANVFRDCLGLTSITFPALSVITGFQAMANCFNGCSNLTSLSFPAIKTTSFGSYTNQFQNICSGVASITIHFPSNVQSVIEGLTGYSTTAPFGATSGTVSFDLPATE